MNNKIPYLLRGFVADVRPHGKPTTKKSIKTITNIINTRVAKGRIELPCSRALYAMAHSPRRCADLHRLRSS